MVKTRDFCDRVPICAVNEFSVLLSFDSVRIGVSASLRIIFKIDESFRIFLPATIFTQNSDTPNGLQVHNLLEFSSAFELISVFESCLKSHDFVVNRCDLFFGSFLLQILVLHYELDCCACGCTSHMPTATFYRRLQNGWWPQFIK